MSNFQALKLEIVAFLGLSKDAVHVYVGLLVFIAFMLFVRRPGSEWWALIGVVLVASGLEFLDLRDDAATYGYMRWTASLHDLANTAFWPAVLALLSYAGLVRFRPLRPVSNRVDG